MKLRIQWAPNLGLIPVIWALFVACKASSLVVAIACLSVYAIGCGLDVIVSLLPSVRSAWEEIR